MKQRILRAFDVLPDRDRDAVIADVLAALSGLVSAPVVKVVEGCRRAGVPILLATAAPGSYARPFAELLALSGCLATDSDAVELVGSAKADAVRQWIVSRLGSIEDVRITTITDHVDDLPLMSMSSHVILQTSPSEAESIAARLGRKSASIENIDPVSAQQGSGMWLWFDERATGPLDVWEVRTVLSKHRYALGYAGASRWTRIRPGDHLDSLVVRRECPTPPPMRQRLSTLLKRRVIRDHLRIFH